MNRDTQIKSILSFVDEHRESTASRIVAAKILGEKNRRVDDEIIKELHAKLPRATHDVIDECFQIIE
ncbi:hypothetical protein [Thermohalobacter berrensis]|uniref:Uncharacterized protein n=1 Tax=Thermohalobacter berrensis TaxID=99594 RepID=A0A419T9Y4_9FIRM|nr:hypothetical protein [Thermohalobacter berrensis]RKD34282.1 hypothetical protein BET03_00160 [Thermohalobacter berrensis]